MLDFRMDTFMVVCKYMNYTKAAESLHITQPAVSQHIRHIEQEYGIKLFGFQGKKMSLTEEGRQLLQMIKTYKHDDSALRRMFHENRIHKKQLLFGVTLTIGEYVIGEYLAGYLNSHPETDIRITIANTAELFHKLDEGILDFALIEGFYEKNNYDFEVFRKERYVGVCAKDHPLADKKELQWEDILHETVISREAGSGTREILERTLKDEGYSFPAFRHVVEISNMNAIKTMVMCRGGISFLYESAVKKELAEGMLRELDLGGFPLYHDFTFIWRKNSIFSDSYRELFEQIV